MKKLIIKYVDKDEFEILREKYPKSEYHESKKYKKLKISPRKEVRCYKE